MNTKLIIEPRPAETQREYIFCGGSVSYFDVREIRVSDTDLHYIKHRGGLSIVKPDWIAINIVAEDWTVAPIANNSAD